jgi:hypothetical protein
LERIVTGTPVALRLVLLSSESRLEAISDSEINERMIMIKRDTGTGHTRWPGFLCYSRCQLPRRKRHTAVTQHRIFSWGCWVIGNKWRG